MTQQNFRYFSWKVDGDWTPHQLLSEASIAQLLRAFQWNREVFASVQRFNEQGVALGCPLFMDFDGKNSIEDARFAYHIIKESLWIEPRVYFSGNKGYHVITDVEIPGEQCHLLAKAIVNRMTKTWKCLDRSIYTSRRMFRISGSPASIPEYYKVRLSPELLDYDTELHREIATKKQKPWGPDAKQTLNEKAWTQWLAAAEEDIKQEPKQSVAASTYKGTDWTPCLEILFNQPQQERHNTAFLLAKWFAKAGLSEPQILSKFLTLPHWKQFEEQEGGVSKVVHGVMKYANQHIGCKSGHSAQLMRQYCDPFCVFAEGSFL